MRLGSYVRRLPNFTEFIDRKKETLNYQIFNSEVSLSKFGDMVWEVKSGNEKKNFRFEIEGKQINGTYVYFWKMLFLITIYQKNSSFKTALAIYNSISFLVRFLQELTDKHGVLFEYFDPSEYFMWIEKQGGSAPLKLSKWKGLLFWRDYNEFLMEDMQLNSSNFELPRVKFMDEPKKRRSENFKGHEPLGFADYAKMITLAHYAIEKYGDLLVEMYERGAGKNEFLTLLKNEKLFEFSEKNFSILDVMRFLQGASMALILGLCPMRHKELRDLKVKHFEFNPSSDYSILYVNVEKTGQGIYKMPLNNFGAKAVRLMQKIQKNQAERYLFSHQNSEFAFDEQIGIKRLEIFARIIKLNTHLTPHRLRTTCARFFLFSKGMEGVYLFKNFVGHTDVAMTLNHYAKYGVTEEASMTSMLYENLMSKLEDIEDTEKLDDTYQNVIELPFCTLRVQDESSLLLNEELAVLSRRQNDEKRKVSKLLRSFLGMEK